MSCVFCEIIAGHLPAQVVYQDERVIIFKDHYPRAQIHLLVCPKNHYATFLEAPDEEVAHLFKVCRRLAEKLGVESGFRLMINNGPQGGQIVFHLHFHFLSWVKTLDQAEIDL